MGTIDDLERKVESLGSQLADAKQKLRDARLAACPIKVDSIVTITGGRWKGRKGRVRAVLLSAAHVPKPWLRVSFPKVNGAWSVSEHSVYTDWEIATP